MSTITYNFPNAQTIKDIINTNNNYFGRNGAIVHNLRDKEMVLVISEKIISVVAKTFDNLNNQTQEDVKKKVDEVLLQFNLNINNPTLQEMRVRLVRLLIQYANIQNY